MRRLPTTLAAATLAALAALAGRGMAAPLHGTPLHSGDRVTGVVDSPVDRDLFRIEVPDGAVLDVSVKAAKKSLLKPTLELFDPSGAPVDLSMYISGQTTPSVSIPGFVAHATGEWTLGVTGYLGATGDYQLTVKVVTATKVRATVTVEAGQTIDHHFVGVDGALVDFTIVEKGGPGLVEAEVCCPADHPIPGTGAVRSGSRLRARKIALDRGGGLYGIMMQGAPGGPTTVDITAVVRFPKVKARRLALGQEPRPAAVSPPIGCNGTPFVVTGENFAAGSRIVFGDAAEATGVVWVSPTEMHGVAPECAASRNGQAAPVSVLAPDGQFGTATPGFAYIGIPAPSGFTPRLSPLEGGIEVTLSGVRFRPGSTVRVAGNPAPSVTFHTAYHLSFITPAAPVGVHDIVVVDEFGRPSEPLPGLWYADPPAVVSATPPVVKSLGGVPVTLVGTGMAEGVRVFVGGTEAVVQSRTPPTSLTFLCPGGRAGPVEVEVRDTLGRSFRGEVLTMTRSFHDASAAALPEPPPGADFWGHMVNLADADGDGLPEILVTSRARWTNPMNGQLMPGSFLLRNDGKGVFSDATGTLPSFGLPEDDGQADAALLGDLDGDRLADAALVRGTPLPSGEQYVSWGRYSGYYYSESPPSFDTLTTSATRLLVNDGTGVFHDRTDSTVPGFDSTPAFGMGERWQGRAAALGDLDADGDADLVLVSGSEVRIGGVAHVRYTYQYVYYGYPYYYYRRVPNQALVTQDSEPRGALRVLENEGGGYFLHDTWDEPYPEYAGSGAVLDDLRGDAIALGDLDGNGTLDAVLVGTERTREEDGGGGLRDAGSLRVILNHGDGALRKASGLVPPAPGQSTPASGEWWQGTSVLLADFDGDGDADVVVGRRTIQPWFDAEAGATRVVPAIRFFRNGGGGDLAEDTSAFLPDELTVLPTSRTILGVTGMAALDVDGDGDTDLVLTGRESTPPPGIPDVARMATRVLVNEGEGGLRDATDEWLTPGDFLCSDGLAAADVDGDGGTDVVLVLHGMAADGKRSLRILMNR